MSSRPAVPTVASATVMHTIWPGILLTGSLALVAMVLARQPALQGTGISALTLAILIGMTLGNAAPALIGTRFNKGIDFSKSHLLRAGIVLYGFRISFQQIAEIGWLGALLAVIVIVTTYQLAITIGTRWFKLDRTTATLIGAGSAICGAAAILATQPLIKSKDGHDEHKVSIAVATIVVFGTLAMLIYPLAYPFLQLSEQAYGLFAGGTIHEVAQVVAAGEAVGGVAANTAVIEKMLRVMMLAPFLLILGFSRRTESEGGVNRIAIPWFAVLFIIASGIHSLHIVPAAVVNAIVQFDTALLSVAMLALGLRTRFSAIRQAGLKPLQLGFTLFACLSVGGYGLVRLLTALAW